MPEQRIDAATNETAEPATNERASAETGPTEPQSRLWRAGRTGWAMLGIAGALVVAGLVAGELALIVVPVVLALFPATLLVPVASKLKQIGIPAAPAALAALLLGFLVIGGIIGAMIPLVVADLPDLVESAGEGIQDIEGLLEDDPLGLGLGGPTELLEAGREQVGEIGQFAGQAAGAAVTAFETLAGLLLLFVVLFFYLKDGRRLTDGLISVAPEQNRSRLRRAADRSWDTLGSYFRGQLLVALVDAVLIGAGLLILGVPLAVPLAVLIFFGGLFPIVGAVTTGALAVLVALADTGLTTALIVVGLILVVQQLESNVLEPLILGKAIDLHPLVVLISITVGAVTLGVLGAFLAVPVAAIIGRIVGSDRDDGEDDRGDDGRRPGATATDANGGPTDGDEDPRRPDDDRATAASSAASEASVPDRRRGGSHAAGDTVD